MGNENETRERPANFQSSSFGDSTPPSKFLGATGTRDGLVIYLSVEMSARTETFPKKSNTTLRQSQNCHHVQTPEEWKIYMLFILLLYLCFKSLHHIRYLVGWRRQMSSFFSLFRQSSVTCKCHHSILPFEIIHLATVRTRNAPSLRSKLSAEIN